MKISIGAQDEALLVQVTRPDSTDGRGSETAMWWWLDKGEWYLFDVPGDHQLSVTHKPLRPSWADRS